MKRPFVIIHTHTSIDGNLDIMEIPECHKTSRQYHEFSLDPEKQRRLRRTGFWDQAK